jgi:hypothetical protein
VTIELDELLVFACEFTIDYLCCSYAVFKIKRYACLGASSQ